MVRKLGGMTMSKKEKADEGESTTPSEKKPEKTSKEKKKKMGSGINSAVAARRPSLTVAGLNHLVVGFSLGF